MKLPTASELPRVFLCPSSNLLPRVEHHGANASFGTAVHGFLADVPMLGREKALERLPPDVLPFCEALELSKIHSLQTNTKTEVALAWNVETDIGRVVGTNRAYELTDRAVEYVGTVDLVNVLDNVVVVGDYKTGYQNRAPAAHDPQLWLYALAAARAFGRSSVVVECIHLPPGSTVPRYERAEFDTLALDMIALELRNLRTKLLALSGMSAPLPVAQGNWCEFCPALPHCPATKALLAMSDAQLAAPVLEMTPMRTADAYRWVKNAKRILARCSEVIESLAEQTGGIELGDGLVYGRHDVRHDKIDGAIAFKVLERGFGRETAQAAVELSTSKSAIEEAVRPLAKSAKLTIKGIKDQVLKEISNHGGISTVVQSRLEEHRPNARS